MGSSGEASGEPRQTWMERQREMYRLRTIEGLTLAEIGKRFGVGPERVRQLINRHIHHTTGQIPNPGQISRTAAEIRRQAEMTRAQEHAVELLVAWREGADIHARESSVRWSQPKSTRTAPRGCPAGECRLMARRSACQTARSSLGATATFGARE